MTKFYTLCYYENSRQTRASKIAFNQSSDIDFEDFMNLCKKGTAKPYFVSAIDTTLTSDDPLRFRNNLLERMWKLIMRIDDKIWDKKLQHDINREAGKILSLT